MLTSPLFRSPLYRATFVCSFALLAFVIARAPLWNSVMAGARVKFGSGQLALVPPAWQCTGRPHVCTTRIGGEPLRVEVTSFLDAPIACAATFRGVAVACNAQLWYAPRLKPFLEIGALPGVSLGAALLERPWRVLDLGLLGESGPLHMWAGVLCIIVLALGAGALVRPGGLWWFARVAVATLTFVLLNVAWFLERVLLGYID